MFYYLKFILYFFKHDVPIITFSSKNPYNNLLFSIYIIHLKFDVLQFEGHTTKYHTFFVNVKYFMIEVKQKNCTIRKY